MEPIILASSSPRRQEILKLLNIPFQVIIPNTDETITQGFSPEEASELIARQKISEIIHSKPMGQEIPWILSADTIILFNGKLYGKPQSHEEAFNFLKEFQGKSHEALTSIVLYNGKTKETVSKTCRTKVTFAKMSDEEIQWYLDTGEWHGASGGYRIQSLASCFIEKIEGSQSCVTGLPIRELYDMLKEQGYSILE